MVGLGRKLTEKVKGRFRTRAVVSGEGDLLFYNSNTDKRALHNDETLGIEMQPDAVSLGALSADTAPTSVGFATEDCDFDRPTAGFASIPEAIEDIRQGKVCSFLHY